MVLALTPPHHGLLGLYSQRGLESWRKLPAGPRPHLQPIRPGVLPLTPVLGFRPVCLCLLSPLQGVPQHQPLLKQHCLQLLKQADHSSPFFLPFLLVLLILNTARRLLGLLSWNEHSPKRLYWINWFLYVCFNFFPFHVFFCVCVCVFFLKKGSVIRWWAHGFRRQDAGCLSSSESPLLSLTETGRQAPKILRDEGILNKWSSLLFNGFFFFFFFTASFLLFYSLKLVFIDHVFPHPIVLFINGSGMPYTY